MFEYIFENKEYERAVRDLKSTLFDIVASENSKLSIIEAKVDSEMNTERKEELEKLCEQQNACLKRVLEISGELSDSLMTLDSYSRELNKLEDKNIAEMIANIGNKQVEKAYQADISKATQQKDDLVQEMIQTASELNREGYPKEDIIGNIKTVQQGIKAEETTDDVKKIEVEIPQDRVETETSEENEEEFEPEEAREGVTPEEDSTNVEVSEDVAEMVPAADFIATDSQEAEEEAYLADVDSSVEVSEGVSEGKTEEELVAPAVVLEPFSIDKNLEKVADQIAVPVINQTNSYEADTMENSNGEFEKEEGYNDDAELVSEDVSKIELPVIEEVQTVEPVGNIQTVSAPTKTPTIEDVEKIVEKQEEVAAENQELVKEADAGIIQKLKFMKANANVTRAILTAKKQITNLRKSKETMKALCNARRKISDISIAEGTVKKIDEAIEENKVIEQQLIDNGLLEPTIVDRQKQIEEMLEKANVLYKEGKVEEAKVMYDQISALNKEIQIRNTIAK